MPNHFACIGFPVTDDASLERIAAETIESGEIREREGGRTVRFRDASGAGLVYQLDADDAVECVTPIFHPTARIEVVAKRFVDDGDCAFCDRLLVDVIDSSGELCYPLAVQLDDVPAAREKVEKGEIVM